MSKYNGRSASTKKVGKGKSSYYEISYYQKFAGKTKRSLVGTGYANNRIDANKKIRNWRINGHR